MKLKELLFLIDNTAKENKLSKPYLVGGIVRDVAMKRFKEVKDVDITCGDANSDKLGQAVLSKISTATYTKFSDGHGCLNLQDMNVDFSNNFNIININDELSKIGINKPNSMEKELYSRDFYINTLLMPLDLSKIYDLTSKGMSDILSKTIDTCLEPNITFLSDPRRVARVIYLGAKLEFTPSKRVIDWIRKNTFIVSKIDKKYVTDKITKAMKVNSKYAFELIDMLGMKQYIPNNEIYNDYVTSNPEILYRSLNG